MILQIDRKFCFQIDTNLLYGIHFLSNYKAEFSKACIYIVGHNGRILLPWVLQYPITSLCESGFQVDYEMLIFFY